MYIWTYVKLFINQRNITNTDFKETPLVDVVVFFAVDNCLIFYALKYSSVSITRLWFCLSFVFL